jgi:hypothetical protein
MTELQVGVAAGSAFITEDRLSWIRRIWNEANSTAGDRIEISSRIGQLPLSRSFSSGALCLPFWWQLFF